MSVKLAAKYLSLAGSAARGLRSRPGRTALTCISLAIGILAIVFVQAASIVAEREIIKPLEMSSGLHGTWQLKTDGSMKSLQSARVAVRHLNDSGTAAAVIVDDHGVDLETSSGEIIALSAHEGDLLHIRPFRIAVGSWNASESMLAPAVVLNRAATRSGEQYAIVTSSGFEVEARVTGVIDDGSLDPQAWIGLDNFLEWTQVPSSASIRILAHKREWSVESVGVQLSWSASIHGIAGREEPMRVDTVDDAASTLEVIRQIFLLAGVVTLVVGTAGVLNIGLASVRERSEEFALRRSLGASKGNIAFLVALDSVFIGVIGSTIASGSAFGIYEIILPRYLTSIEYGSFPFSAYLVGLLAGVAAGIFGGIIPAARAARQPIAIVMRA
ncbi:ABC transporter permease [Streptomyces sp. enrichment culture]|uniref:ABC transporter permease n=1 Tax=Streptomyces sp. enrichment culture TaxID=1795815 RepID=UPI003F57C275